MTIESERMTGEENNGEKRMGHKERDRKSATETRENNGETRTGHEKKET
jgi:hypothetical protein